ncbi:MAG: HlyD family type I secretion periplasmic adaptor subunit, partial [Deltaproteobacteria bacterium HGW-Deltaproteobacteria-24]
SQHNNQAMIPYIQNEQSLYQTNLKQLNSDLEVLNEQLLQKRNDLEDAKSKKIYLSKSLAMVRKEINMTEPMVERGVASQVDLLRLQKEENQSIDEFKSAEFAIIRYESEIKEILHKIDSAKFSFQSKAKEKLTETISEYKRTVSNSKALQDQVTRTVVKAPRDGIIQKLFVNTIGGVVKPGDNLVEIVPSNEKLLVNAKISPADIAFIYPSQKAIVKFSAYDFSIFGGMEAKVVSISPDTIKDKDEKTYYIVRIETQNDTLKHSNKTMKIIPGMTAQVDILTGKKSILSYILKPILKTKQYAFGDR